MVQPCEINICTHVDESEQNFEIRKNQNLFGKNHFDYYKIAGMHFFLQILWSRIS